MLNELYERLSLWKDFELPNIIERELRIPETADIIAVYGPRRAGKTYFMFQMMKNLIENGIPKENILYVNFDDIIFRKYDVKKIFNAYFELFNPKGEIYLFLDEIQNLTDWPIWLRTLYDEGYRIFITGSSSKLMIQEIAKELRGRYTSRLILPFSFREFLKLNKFEFIDTYVKSGEIKNFLREYLTFGGFPEVISIKNRLDKREKLLSIYETTFYRDFVERYKVREIEIAKVLLEFILSNTSKAFSITKIHNTFKTMGINVSKRTLWKYYNEMIESLLFFEVNIFTYSKRKEILFPRKVYSVDTGISNLAKTQIESILAENIIFLELLRRNNNIYYYLTKSRKEIDFYIPNRSMLIEVSLEYDDEHIKKLKEAMNELKINEAYIITWDHEDEKEFNYSGKIYRIKFIPLWKWLLKNYNYNELSII